MYKSFQIIQIILFLLIFGSGWVSIIIAPDNSKIIQILERRNPSVFPKVPALTDQKASATALIQLEKFFNDSLIQRFWGNSAYQFLRSKLNLYSLDDSSIIGRNGWYYLGQSSIWGNPWLIYERQRGLLPLTDEAILEKSSIFVSACNVFIEQQIPCYIAFIPNKHRVHPENLPRGLPIVTESTPMKQIIPIIEATGIPVLDLQKPMFVDKQKFGQPLYYKTDHHWNPWGAMVGWSHMLKWIGRSITVPQLNLTAFQTKISKHGSGSAVRSLGIPSGWITDENVMPVWNERNTPKPFEGKLLLIGDSFVSYSGNILKRLFPKHRTSSINFKGKEFPELAKEYKPDLVIIMHVDHWLPMILKKKAVDWYQPIRRK